MSISLCDITTHQPPKKKEKKRGKVFGSSADDGRSTGDTPTMKGPPNATNTATLNYGRLHVATVFRVTRRHTPSRSSVPGRPDSGSKPLHRTRSTHSGGSDAPGISHLQRRQPAEQGPSHPGVPFLRQRVQRRRTHAPGRANTGHLGLCGLSSLATCTRPAMWARTDCVPRETRNRGAGGERQH